MSPARTVENGQVLLRNIIVKVLSHRIRCVASRRTVPRVAASAVKEP